MTLRRVLIANRGEIAVRVMRTCREMGIATVAVYSDVDADAPHVRAADHSALLGGAQAAESYLDIEKLIAAAKSTDADAIHPGYGFLSENAGFAAACETAGVTFIGPSSSVIRRMGSKTAAREAVRAAGVPVVPGEAPQAQDPAVIRAAVASVGVPLILKAVAGGGGKGMRIVRDPKDIADAVDAASREALRAFGDGTLYVERLIEAPRHIEVQVLGDTQGHVVHLFERDCTLQRRHQKVIEEAPAPRLAPAVRAKLLDAAVAAARAVGYVSAGTVEFLLEGEGDDAQFYFLEMNTRLQVEHPITEAITGIDLVRAQLDIAAGQPLPFSQADITVTGHAVESRIYAEDSVRLLPQSGRIGHYAEPKGPGVRVDSGVTAGQRVTVHYDPLLAKLITHGATREEALARMALALKEFEILGLHHNIAFLGAVLSRPEVAAATCDTDFIERHLAELAVVPPDDVRRAAAAIAAFVADGGLMATRTVVGADAPDRRHDIWGGPGATPAAPGRDPWTDLGRIAW